MREGSGGNKRKNTPEKRIVLVCDKHHDQNQTGEEEASPTVSRSQSIPKGGHGGKLEAGTEAETTEEEKPHLLAYSSGSAF